MRSFVRFDGRDLELASRYSDDARALRRKFDELHRIGVRLDVNAMWHRRDMGLVQIECDIPEDPTGMLLP